MKLVADKRTDLVINDNLTTIESFKLRPTAIPPALVAGGLSVALSILASPGFLILLAGIVFVTTIYIIGVEPDGILLANKPQKISTAPWNAKNKYMGHPVYREAIDAWVSGEMRNPDVIYELGREIDKIEEAKRKKGLELNPPKDYVSQVRQERYLYTGEQEPIDAEIEESPPKMISPIGGGGVATQKNKDFYSWVNEAAVNRYYTEVESESRRRKRIES